MKIKALLLLLISTSLLCGCTSSQPSNNPGGDDPGTNPGGDDPGTNPGGGGEEEPPSGPTKVVVAKHTLKDTNPPINVNSKGQKVSEDTWNAFKYGAASKFKGNYNFTYTAYSGGYYTVQRFTKNGYALQTSSGTLYYERKSGNTFYNYISTNEGYLRQETTLNLESIYTDRIYQEIKVHMFDFDKYEYDDSDGTYYYLDYGFGATVVFKGGYLTQLTYALGANIFRIDTSFETTIDIPESYYYK